MLPFAFHVKGMLANTFIAALAFTASIPLVNADRLNKQKILTGFLFSFLILSIQSTILQPEALFIGLMGFGKTYLYLISSLTTWVTLVLYNEFIPMETIRLKKYMAIVAGLLTPLFYELLHSYEIFEMMRPWNLDPFTISWYFIAGLTIGISIWTKPLSKEGQPKS